MPGISAVGSYVRAIRKMPGISCSVVGLVYYLKISILRDGEL